MGDQHTIKMEKVLCNKLKHTNEFIRILCLNPKCAESSTLCAECLEQNHLGCRSQVLKFEEIPQQLIELQQLRLAIQALEDKINQQFKNLLAQIEYIFQPISKYQQTPNLTNLNEIGQLLRRNPGQKILHIIDETKTQIRCLLENHNCQQGFNQTLETIPKQQVTRQENERSTEKTSQNTYNRSENDQQINIQKLKIIEDLESLLKEFQYTTLSDKYIQQIIESMKKNMEAKDLIQIFQEIQKLFDKDSHMFKLFGKIITSIQDQYTNLNLTGISRLYIQDYQINQISKYIIEKEERLRQQK